MGKTFVVDSSVIVKWINSEDEKWLDNADHILEDVKKKGITLIAPELAKYEVGNVLLRKKMEPSQAKSSLATVYALPIQFISQDEEQARHTMDIAQQHNITFYDASFLSLAQKTNAVIITDNPKHQQKKVLGVKVVALAEY
ncbi:MAG: hypothetical protein A2804_02020 [Candidatus Pacebacteria bacterium RIFCSPHIGHO2_01_FULL_46_10]|nr:MAG: hypothetical protein A2804_02020 [Candidatus Pacebacteria bacterium RIFCSPHIGHO2_01_FULL_46_10]